MVFAFSSMDNFPLTKLKTPSGLSQLHTGTEFAGKNFIMKWGLHCKTTCFNFKWENSSPISSQRNLDLCRLGGKSKEFKLLGLLNSI